MPRLSDPTVRNLSKPGLHPDGGGLYLAVTPRKDGSFGRSWLVRYTTLGGRRREMGLGSYPAVSLATARRMAAERRAQAKNGVDPLEVAAEAKAAAIKAERTSATFRQCAEAYLADAVKQERWKNAKHAAQWASTLRAYAFPVFGSMPVSRIDTPIVIKALEPIWATKTVTARRLQRRIEIVLGWATLRGHREGPNPAQWRSHLEIALPLPRGSRIKHHPALSYAELPAFMAKLHLEHSGAAAAGLEFAILTAGRTGEVLGARWSEIDLEARTWTVPAARMKGGREHRVPLSGPAVDVLMAIKRRHVAEPLPEFVFLNPAGEPLSTMALLMLLRRMGRRDVTVHGFRSTFRDWVSEKTEFRSEIAEAALAHAIGDKTEAAYRRGDLFEKRRKLMEAWGAFAHQRIKRATDHRTQHTGSKGGQNVEAI